MKSSELNFGLLVVALVAAAYALGQSRSTDVDTQRDAAHEFDVLQALPQDASLALTLDFEGKEAEPLRNLLLRRGRELPDVGHLKDVCGYDPTGDIRKLALALFVPDQRGAQPAILVATRGGFDTSRVVACAKRLVERRGAAPTTKQVSGFQFIGGGDESTARIAVRPDGLVLLGEETELERMLASANGQSPNLAEHPSHRRLRSKVGRAAPVVLSVVLESGWLARFLSPEDRARSDASPLAAVRGAALSLGFDEDAELRARLECTSDESCQRLARLCRELWKNVEPAIVRLGGAGSTRQAQMTESDRALDFSWRVAPQALEELVFQWPTLERLANTWTPPSPEPSPSSPSPAFVPDRVIEAPRGSASAVPQP